MSEFLLPGDSLGGVPDHLRDEVAMMVLTAKYCAVVEAAVKINGGKPIPVSMDRVGEIAAMTARTDPNVTVMVKETPDGGVWLIGLASPDDVRKGNRLHALRQMGSRRN